ncbi:CBS domain-containing protein [Pseudodesulfovibrio sp.]|nr:CBS domain-containing protein [Pseudodesulfovibrio sp.]
MKVTNLMTPVDEYKTIGLDALLGEVVVALADSKHRDILVLDESGAFAGVLTMSDIIMALEPNYKKLGKKDLDSDILSNRFVADLFKEFDLWSNTLADLCKKGCNIKVADAMYTPAEEEYLDQDSDLEHGVHHYVIGTHQPIIVRNNGDVTGVLRMADVFEEIIKRMNVCSCEQ